MKAIHILEEIETLGSESYKKILFKNYGVQEPCFGVKIGDLKKIQKRIKKDYRLALDLYDSGNYDAMYLAGLIADDLKMTKKDLNRWVRNSNSGALSGSTVPWVAAESRYGHELALKWITSSKNKIASAGWATFSSLVSIKNDEELAIPELKKLLKQIKKTIHQAPDTVRYAMNGFVIAVGCYVELLTDFAIYLGEKIGTVTANLDNNNCQIPSAPDSIRKVQKRGTIGKKRKTAKC